jgi:DNA replication protein DnaC
MLNQVTIDKMQAMKLTGLAGAFQRQISSPEYASLSFEERVGMLIDEEWTARERRKLVLRLQNARLRYPASLEDVDFQTPRGLDRSVVLSLSSCSWIAEHHNLLILGPTGTGKSFLACAFAERACRSGYTAVYLRTPRLLQDLAVARGDGSYGRLLARLARVDLLVCDDWLLAPLKDAERRDLLEVIEDRTERRSTLIAGQLPIASWHEVIGDPTLADALCDRLVHRAHRILLKGPSQRQLRAKGASTEKKEAAPR